MNFYLITMDTHDEIMFYMSKQRKGMKILNGCLVFSLVALSAITVLYLLNNGNNYEYYFGKASENSLPPVGI